MAGAIPAAHHPDADAEKLADRARDARGRGAVLPKRSQGEPDAPALYTLDAGQSAARSSAAAALADAGAQPEPRAWPRSMQLVEAVAESPLPAAEEPSLPARRDEPEPREAEPSAQPEPQLAAWARRA